MLISDRKKVVLDTSVILRGLMAKKDNKKESFCYKILRQFESNHFKLMMNARIKEEYERKLNEHIHKGTIDAIHVGQFMELVISDKALYDRMFITPPIDVIDDPTDNIFFMSNNCLSANFLITENSKHLNDAIREDLKKLRSSLQIVNPAEFLGELVRTKIYVSHSTAFNYKDELYSVLRSSTLNEKHNIIFPHDQSGKQFNSKDIIPTCDFVLAEVSYPSTGQGIELGWSDSANIPIICIYKKGAKFSNSLKVISKKIVEYETEHEMIEKIDENLFQMS